MVHLYQESMVELGVEAFRSCRGGYHNQNFVSIAEEIGLHPKLGEGYHVRPADAQFAKLMDRWAVALPAPPKASPPGQEPKADWWSSTGANT